MSAGGLIVLIVLGAVFTYLSVNDAQEQTSRQLTQQNQVVDLMRNIQRNVLDSYIAIDAFLLQPSDQRQKELALQAIDAASQASNQIRPRFMELFPGQIDRVEEVSELLASLRAQTVKLLEVRVNPTQQYPSLEVAARVMRPNNDRFNNEIALVLLELREEGLDADSYEIFAHWVEVRHLWSQMLSMFRIYTANRIGSFNEQTLIDQENSVISMYQTLMQRLEFMEELDQQDLLGFQASASLPEMIQALRNWYGGFIQVREIHAGDGWRLDSKIMRDKIVPLLNRISELLADLESALQTAADSNVSKLSESISRQIYILAFSTLTFLVVLVSMFVATNRLVFTPIAQIVRALKSESFAKKSLVLPKIRSNETEALIDAFQEMSERIQRRQNDLEYQALHDALSGLPNRTLLQERIEYYIQLAQRDQKQLSLLMIDLDRFKEINDTLGHHIGDQVLIEVGKRLRASLRKIDTVARLGGDEFAILLPNSNLSQSEEVTKKIIDAMQMEFQARELRLSVDMSIGIACFPDHCRDTASLLQNADIAMYDAKQNHRDYAIYDPEKDEYSLVRLELINDLKEALGNDDLFLHYQPLVDLSCDRLYGVEALLRWEHPQYGNIPAEQIISMAEQTGLMNRLTYWVLNRALQEVSALHIPMLCVAVNISVYNLRETQFVEQVREILHDSGLAPQRVILEITESAMMSNPLHAIEILGELDRMGFRLAVDDFGTGFSSLAYLKELPVDELKIDRSFIANMTEDSSDDMIVRSTIELAHNLNLRVVAEGIETLEHYQLLSRYGCDFGQGYHIQKPCAAKQLVEWVDHGPYYTSSQEVNV